ncbi:unnamed protein product [Musa banksii]
MRDIKEGDACHGWSALLGGQCVDGQSGLPDAMGDKIEDGDMAFATRAPRRVTAFALIIFG